MDKQNTRLMEQERITNVVAFRQFMKHPDFAMKIYEIKLLFLDYFFIELKQYSHLIIYIIISNVKR